MVHPCFVVIKLGAGQQDLSGVAKTRSAAINRLAIRAVLVFGGDSAGAVGLRHNTAALVGEQVGRTGGAAAVVTHQRVVAADAMHIAF